jgi:predicted nucleic acid-binding protein
MTEAVVIDASIAVARVRRETGWEDVNQRIATWQRTGTRLAVPSHFWLEVSNGLMRRHGLGGSQVMEAVHRLDEIGLETVALDRPILLLALDRAERFGLTTYDAAYLAVAEALDATLYTFDQALLFAAGSRGLDVESDPSRRLSEKRAHYGPERASTWPDYSGASAYLAKLRSEAFRPA